MSTSDTLRDRIRNLEHELDDLKRQLLEAEAAEIRYSEWAWPLDAEEYQRYGRQMIMPEIGLQGLILY